MFSGIISNHNLSETVGKNLVVYIITFNKSLSGIIPFVSAYNLLFDFNGGRVFQFRIL